MRHGLPPLNEAVCLPCKRGQHDACEDEGPFGDPRDGDFFCICRDRKCAEAHGRQAEVS